MMFLAMDPSHWLVGGMTIGAVIFLVAVEVHSRRKARLSTGTEDQQPNQQE